MEREVSELDRKLILKRNYLDKIYYYLNKDPIGQDELYIFVRKFFGEYLKLDYEFTYEELSQELNKAFIKPKAKERIDNFLLRLSESEYLEESNLGTVEINSYLTELNDIIKEIIYEEHSIIPESSIIKKVLNINGSEENISEINSMVDEAIFHINKGNIDGAKKTYENIMKNYDALSKSDKKKVVDKVTDIYEKIQSGSKNKKVATAEDMYKDSKNSIEDKKTKLNKTIIEAQTYIDNNNIDLAKSTYSDALKIYEQLEGDPKKEFSKKILELYESLKNPNKRKAKTEQVTTNQLPSTSNIASSDITKNTISEIPNDEIKIDIEEAIAEARLNPNITTQTYKESQQQISSTSETSDIEKENKTTIKEVSKTQEKSEVKPLSMEKDASGNIIFSFGSDDLKNLKISDNPLNSDAKNLSNLNIKTEESSKVSSNVAIQNNIQEPLDEDENKLLDFSNNIKNQINTLLENNKVENIDKDSESKNVKQKSVQELNIKVDLKDNSELKTKLETKLNANAQPQSESIESKNYVLLTPISNNIKSENNDDKKENKNKELNKSKIDTNKQELETESKLKISSLNKLLERTDDDILVGKLDNAKKLYKEALLIYRSMNDKEKYESYNKFYSTFKNLDEALHKEQLNKTIDEHLNQQPVLKRNITDNNSNDTEYVPQSLEVLKITTLPVIMDADPDVVRLYELIEESYFNISQNNSDIAVHKYFKALETYRKLNNEDKKKTYPNIYELFKKISSNSQNN